MKIAYIITDYGAFNNFLAELSVNLLQKKYEIHVICSNDKVINRKDKYNYVELGINFYHLEFPRGFNFLKHLKISKKIHHLLEKIDPDLVHINFTTAAFTTLLYKKPRFPTLGTFHGLGFPVLSGRRRKIFKLVENFCFTRLDQIWLLNKVDYDIVNKTHPHKAFYYDSAGLGCDLDKFNPENFSQGSKSILKKKLEIRPDDFVITFTGRYVDFKGYHLVVRSFFEAFQKHKNLKLILLGGRDPIHPTGLSKEEEEQLLECPNIIDIGFTHEIEKYLSISDVFLFPSVKEGVPVCIIEALAMAVPVITADSRGCNELIFDYKNGLLIANPPMISDIVGKIYLLINNNEYLKKLANQARNDRTIYGRENFIEEQCEIYNLTISRSKRKEGQEVEHA
ncbi:Glycosyltransferase involved in cell wall bisynthesis [Salegentibacter echinorum]|uniref:Glycosyltransferase involved in cell wall bisynthesis n=1 Tax=Salegentibacter echinorum TaxID=1073325 RepID=A0A1M5BV74_SALEC|nr:glycosyltransferase [Salegentibacter echinorum]SHF46429.1 Glycosyltransferase involved in cell wall bisynthesis [Salegentibacter echinorum]